MTLLQGQYIIDAIERNDAAVDIEQLAKIKLLRSIFDRLIERDDLFEIEDSFMGATCKFRAYVFSEAELAEYKNRVITEFMGYTGVFATRPTLARSSQSPVDSAG